MFLVYSLWFIVWSLNFQPFVRVENLQPLLEPIEPFFKDENNSTIPPLNFKPAKRFKPFFIPPSFLYL